MSRAGCTALGEPPKPATAQPDKLPANPPVKPLAGKPAKLWWLLLMPMALF